MRYILCFLYSPHQIFILSTVFNRYVRFCCSFDLFFFIIFYFSSFCSSLALSHSLSLCVFWCYTIIHWITRVLHTSRFVQTHERDFLVSKQITLVWRLTCFWCALFSPVDIRLPKRQQPNSIDLAFSFGKRFTETTHNHILTLSKRIARWLSCGQFCVCSVFYVFWCFCFHILFFVRWFFIIEVF